MSKQSKLGQQRLSEPNTVAEALTLLRQFGFESSVLDDNLFINAKNLVLLNNELLQENE